METTLPLPKYRQIYLLLRERLREGCYDRDGVPGECLLAARFGVGRITVRKAMEILVADGLVSRRPRLGTWPLHAPDCQQSDASSSGPRAQLKGLLENIVDMGLKTSVEVLDSTVVTASSTVAEALRIRLGEPVFRTVRIRSTVQGPLSHITTYVPSAVATLHRRDLTRKPLLMLLEEAGVRFGGATQTVSAQLADAVTARHLDVSIDSALLAVTRLVNDVEEQPVQLLRGLYRADRYHYALQLSRSGQPDTRIQVRESLSAQFH
jgi:GntR family transcriptional regulator